MDDLERKKREALTQLQLVEDEKELTEVCGLLNIDIPAAKAGNTQKLFTLIMRYLNSEEVEDSTDHGMQVFTDLTSHLKGKTVVKKESSENTTSRSGVDSAGPVTDGGLGTSSNSTVLGKVEAGGGDGAQRTGDASAAAGGSNLGVNGATAAAVSAAFNLQRWREFKITGGSVATGEKPLSYSSVRYQMNCGKEQGYTAKEVMSGVIKAMHPSHIRQYFETEENLTEEDFTDALRTYYGITDHESLVDELDHAAQGKGEKIKADETVQDFVYRIGNLRNDIVTVSREEGEPLTRSYVQKKFLKALSVGLREDSIRLQLLPVLKDDTISDQDIRTEIKKIVARNKEHQKRTEGSNVSVKSAGVSHGKESAETAAVLAAVNKISAQVNELSTTQANEINTLRQQVEMLTKRMASDEINRKDGDGNRRGGGFGGDGNRRGGGFGGSKIPRNLLNTCSECEKANTNIKCQHCTICCESGHKRVECPKNR